MGTPPKKTYFAKNNYNEEAWRLPAPLLFWNFRKGARALPCPQK
jgi:hypothetical protein